MCQTLRSSGSQLLCLRKLAKLQTQLLTKPHYMDANNMCMACMPHPETPIMFRLGQSRCDTKAAATQCKALPARIAG